MIRMQVNGTLKPRLTNKLKQMAETPKAQIKRLAVGTFTSLLAMIAMLFTSRLENQGLFYILALLLVAGIVYAIPGYVGVWVWRMKDTLFRNKK